MNAMIRDLWDINRIIKKINEEENPVRFPYLGEKENIEVIGIGDVSYKSGEKAIGGELILLHNKKMNVVSLIYWK